MPTLCPTPLPWQSPCRTVGPSQRSSWPSELHPLSPTTPASCSGRFSLQLPGHLPSASPLPAPSPCSRPSGPGSPRPFVACAAACSAPPLCGQFGAHRSPGQPCLLCSRRSCCPGPRPQPRAHRHPACHCPETQAGPTVLDRTLSPPPWGGGFPSPVLAIVLPVSSLRPTCPSWPCPQPQPSPVPAAHLAERSPVAPVPQPITVLEGQAAPPSSAAPVFPALLVWTRPCLGSLVPALGST